MAAWTRKPAARPSLPAPICWIAARLSMMRQTRKSPTWRWKPLQKGLRDLVVGIRFKVSTKASRDALDNGQTGTYAKIEPIHATQTPPQFTPEDVTAIETQEKLWLDQSEYLRKRRITFMSALALG